MQFEKGETYAIDELPENQMNNSGKLEWVNDNTLALALGEEHDYQVVEFEFSHVKAIDVYAIDPDTGERVAVEELRNKRREMERVYEDHIREDARQARLAEAEELREDGRR